MQTESLPAFPEQTDSDRLLARVLHFSVPSRAAYAPEPQPPFDRYEKEAHKRPPPPGLPFGYVLECTEVFCGNCGHIALSSRLIEVSRAGYGSKSLEMGASSPIHDRAIKRVNLRRGTPACLRCIQEIRPIPVQYPVPGKAVGLYKPTDPLNAGTSKSKPAPTAVADVLDDFS